MLGTKDNVVVVANVNQYIPLLPITTVIFDPLGTKNKQNQYQLIKWKEYSQ